MAGKQAKILSDQAARDLLSFADMTRHPDRNRAIILLSLKAGLRAAEIAKLTWDMVESAEGEIGATIEVRDSVAKKRHGRRIPVQKDLRQALLVLRRLSPGNAPRVTSNSSGCGQSNSSTREAGQGTVSLSLFPGQELQRLL
ncbi:tyrosine-type recombinase/integrase [Bradyrhizobium sp. YCK136]|uniref:tyrosine-type recombinase/integrase n=1 Tax=Bradyrhizobium TaxID=374 RepID=UPI0037CB32D3